MADAIDPGSSGTGGGRAGTAAERPGASATPAAAALGTAADLRKRLEASDKKVRELEEKWAKQRAADPDAVVPASEAATYQALIRERDQISDNLRQASAAEKPTTVTPSAQDQYIIQFDEKGQMIRDPATGKPPENPNWDKTTKKPQVVTHNNNIIVIDSDGNPKVTYTDKDAQELASRQTAVAESTARTAAAAQKATELAEKARIEIEQAKARGEDAQSIQNQLVIDLRKAHDEWLREDGSLQTANTALRDYNTNRHAIALETISKEEIEQKREAERNLNARSIREQDLTKAAADATVKAQLANQRVSSGAAYLGGALNTMAELNKTVQPGSDAVAGMLPGLLNLGEAFLSKLGGLPDDVTSNPLAKPATKTDGKPVETKPGEVAADAARVLDETAAANQAKLAQGAMAKWNQTNQESRYGHQQAAYEAGMGLVPGEPAYSPPAYDFGWNPNFRYNPLDPWAGLPHFAQGGVVTEPTLGVVGEAGPELIVPLGGQPNASIGAPAGPGGPMPGGPLPGGPIPPPPPPAPPVPPPVPSGPPTVGPGSTVSQFLNVMSQLLASESAAAAPPAPPPPPAPGADPMAAMAAMAAGATGNPPPAGANPALPGSAVPGVPPAAAAAQARMQPIAPDGSPFAKPDDVARIFGREPTVPQGPQMASAPGGGMPQPQMPMPAGAMR